MFVRLFVDENLDRMVPISRQPREKVQAIIGKSFLYRTGHYQSFDKLLIEIGYLKDTFIYIFLFYIFCFLFFKWLRWTSRFLFAPVSRVWREGAQAYPHLFEIVPAAQADKGFILVGHRCHFRRAGVAQQQSTDAAALDVGRGRTNTGPSLWKWESKC